MYSIHECYHRSAADDVASGHKRSSTGSSRTDIDSALLDVQTENPDTEEGADTDDPLEFLEGIGLEKSHFPSLRAAKVKQ